MGWAVKSKPAMLRHLKDFIHFMTCVDLRCGDDLISGSPDQQDWSLVSAQRVACACVNHQPHNCEQSTKKNLVLLLLAAVLHNIQ